MTMENQVNSLKRYLERKIKSKKYKEKAQELYDDYMKGDDTPEKNMKSNYTGIQTRVTQMQNSGQLPPRKPMNKDDKKKKKT